MNTKKLGKMTSIIFLYVAFLFGIAAIILDSCLNQGNRIIFSMLLDLLNSLVIVISIITGGVAVSGAIDKYKNKGVEDDSE